MNRGFVYILTNSTRSVLYTGVTSDLRRRLLEHANGCSIFTARYKTYSLVYFEEYPGIEEAIHREKQIKSWSRKRKMALIDQMNPTWRTLNNEIIE